MTFSPTAQRPSRADLLLVAAYWLVVAPVLLLQYRADTGWDAWRVAPLVGATVLFDTATVAVLVGGLLPLFLGARRGLGVGLLPLFLLLSGGAYISLYGHLLGNSAAFSGARIVLGAVQHAKSYGLLAVLLTGQRYFAAQRRVLLLQKAQAESELRSLKAQIDPHFLFNNLNILYALIQQDQQLASHYLSCFAALYRYLIRHKDDDFVSLAEELKFVDDYIYLLTHRFGQAYSFHRVLLPGASPEGRFVVPATLQLLVENAVKHNRGDDDNPLAITISVRADTVSVRNQIRPKLSPVDSAGTGLLNLRERYRILANRELRIRQDDFFEVLVPVLQAPA